MSGEKEVLGSETINKWALDKAGGSSEKGELLGYFF